MVWDYYARNSRDLPWRTPEQSGVYDPYEILVSEIMLQQTQVPRVVPKYLEFLKAFPDVQTLSRSSLGDVIRAWQGLGYNRRAKFLYQAAQKIMTDFEGNLPISIAMLETLPGVGKNTAGAICVYAYNQPVVFIETNIRTVYIHHFFNDQDDVDDKKILDIVAQTIDYENPRVWYWALMDYGTYLKSQVGNSSRQSKSYVKQSKFEGSKRQIRGAVLRNLATDTYSLTQLSKLVPDERLHQVIDELEKEGLIVEIKSAYALA